MFVMAYYISDVNFHVNRTLRTVSVIIKNCRWGGGGERAEPKPVCSLGLKSTCL